MIITDFKRLIDSISTSATGVRYTDVQLKKLLGYIDLLIKWGGRMSLVSSTDRDRILYEHILDSIAVSQNVSRETFSGEGSHGIDVSRETLLDIGSGAGLPGIVLAILEPERPVVLVEPRKKRADFLKECRRVLELANLTVITCRLEEMGGQGVDGPFHATQRAVGREVENYNYLSTNFPGSILSSIVSKEWNIPDELREAVHSDLSYELPGPEERRVGRVVSFKCFT